MVHTFEFNLKPIPYSQPRIFNNRAVKSKKDRDYQNIIQAIAKQQYDGEPIDCAMAVTITCYFERPKSVPKSRVFPDRKPDLDNLAKNILDPMERAGVFANDSRIVDLTVKKRYSEKERVCVLVREKI